MNWCYVQRQGKEVMCSSLALLTRRWLWSSRLTWPSLYFTTVLSVFRKWKAVQIIRPLTATYGHPMSHSFLYEHMVKVYDTISIGNGVQFTRLADAHTGSLTRCHVSCIIRRYKCKRRTVRLARVGMLLIARWPSGVNKQNDFGGHLLG